MAYTSAISRCGGVSQSLREDSGDKYRAFVLNVPHITLTFVTTLNSGNLKTRKHSIHSHNGSASKASVHTQKVNLFFIWMLRNFCLTLKSISSGRNEAIFGLL
jgi:hypothetical protein